ncbi:MAG TPA: hypothetical protein VJ881_06325 [Halanaerobiales bacterium]|nr:hypothetical protein [Halanaerobiales bacterium]
MKKLIYVSMALVLILTAVNGIGEASLSDNLVLVPEASLVEKTGEISGDLILDEGLGNGKVSGAFKLTPWLEAGVVVSEGTRSSELRFDPLVKAIIINEYNYGLDLAAGLRGEDLYITGAKTLDYGLRGHFGVGNGGFDGIFLGLTKVLNTNDIEITEEEEENNNALSSLPPVKASIEFMDGRFNIGFRSNITNELKAELSVLNLNRLKAGLSYSF